MNCMDIIDRVDIMEPNAYCPEQKLKWLSILDGKIYEEVIRPCEESPAGFTEYSNGDEELIVPFPYDYDIYYHYLMAMIDAENSETQRYNKRMTMFNNAYTEFINWYNKSHNRSRARPGKEPKHFLF